MLQKSLRDEGKGPGINNKNMWLCKRIQISMIWFNAKVNKNILKLLNYKTFYLILQHSQLTMLWEFHDGQQRDSVIYIYLYPFSPKLRSHPGCHKILSRVSCAIHTVGPCWLSILNRAVYACPSHTPELFLHSIFKSNIVDHLPASPNLHSHLTLSSVELWHIGTFPQNL